MISVRQVHFVEEHWESIAARALARLRRELPHSHALSDEMILERVQDLFGHLGDWLSASDPEQISRYEQVGRGRALENISLHDVVRTLQIIRQCAVDYVRENVVDNAVALMAENDLEYSVDRFFDLVIYHVVKGYEGALRQKPQATAQAV